MTTLIPNTDGRIPSYKRCQLCDKEVAFEIYWTDFVAWYEGTKAIEDAAPYLNPEQQCMLTSNTCTNCLS